MTDYESCCPCRSIPCIEQSSLGDVVFYVYLNSSTYGPYTIDQIRQMLAQGTMSVATLVFKQHGAQQWLPAQQFPELLLPPSAGALVPNPTVSSVPITGGTIEVAVWQGSPSVWTILGFILHAAVAICLCVWLAVWGSDIVADHRKAIQAIATTALAVQVLYLVWRLVELKCIRWTVTSERVVRASGVFSRKTENLELYRIKDISLDQPLLMRLVGRGYVQYCSSDLSPREGKGRIGAVQNPTDLYELIRKYAERQRQTKGVQEVDYYHV